MKNVKNYYRIRNLIFIRKRMRISSEIIEHDDINSAMQNW